MTRPRVALLALIVACLALLALANWLTNRPVMFP
jgi:hypothetical protein